MTHTGGKSASTFDKEDNVSWLTNRLALIATTVRQLHDSDQENAHILNVFYRGSEAVPGAVPRDPTQLRS